MARSTSWFRITAAMAVTGLGMLLAPAVALAVPSFARQTGMACEACHTVFPELTPFGRRFKLNGYTIDNLPQVSGISANREQTLALNQLPPLSFMFQASYSSTKTALPDTQLPGELAKNGQVLFPQQAQPFLCRPDRAEPGRVRPDDLRRNRGAVRLGQHRHPLRHVSRTTTCCWGISVNNNPTVQDPWNTTPAWQSPFDQRSATAPGPGAGTMIDGGLADAGVAGASVYFYINNSVYAELGGYHSAPAVAQIDSTSTSVVKGLAPYWRIAYEHQWDRNSWQVGAYGVEAQAVPGWRHAAVGRDRQVQRPGDRLAVPVHRRRAPDLGASGPTSTRSRRSMRPMPRAARATCRTISRRSGSPGATSTSENTARRSGTSRPPARRMTVSTRRATR